MKQDQKNPTFTCVGHCNKCMAAGGGLDAQAVDPHWHGWRLSLAAGAALLLPLACMAGGAVVVGGSQGQVVGAMIGLLAGAGLGAILMIFMRRGQRAAAPAGQGAIGGHTPLGDDAAGPAGTAMPQEGPDQ